MTTEIALTLTIIAAAVVLFATEKLRVDVIALIVLLAVALTGLVSPEEAFAGFANTAVITVWAVYIVSGALFKTGVADILGRGILRLAGTSEPRLIAVIMLTCGIMSGFMNNVGATAMLLPAVVGISRRAKVPVSRLLIPLSFSSLLGGKLTLIGTPANILGTSILADRGLPAFGFFEFVPIGAIFLGVGIVYMLLAGRHLLPVRESPDDRQAAYQLREYVSEVLVAPESPLAGRSLVESRLGADYELTVLAIEREGQVQTTLHLDTSIQPGDLLVVEGSVQNLMRAEQALRLKIGLDRVAELEQLEGDKAHLVEATLAPRSRMVEHTLGEMGFRTRYGFSVLAIRRYGEVIAERLREVRLQFGDALLLQGPRERLPTLQEGGDFLVLEPVTLELRRRHKAIIAVAIMGLVLTLVIVARFHISTAMVIGSVLMVLTGCLAMDEAYESIDWRTVFLVAGMLPLGTAMESSGAAQFLADLLLGAVGGLGPLAVLTGIYILVALITQPMSNAAAVVLIVPIAIDTALGLGADPKPFVLATILGAATSFLTPVGHKANVLVFGPGGYRFFDYTRVGLPLTVLLLIVTLVFVPVLWPLF
ncbi:MAG: SLC13 family permease [Anaerolineales bacterium]|nr:MAG: SLC13 family permease [Anaerolineales bacterium]